MGILQAVLLANALGARHPENEVRLPDTEMVPTKCGSIFMLCASDSKIEKNLN